MFHPKGNRIYILPNKDGLIFIGIIILFFIISILYGNNLCYIIFFTVTSFFIMSLVYTHFNLTQVEIEMCTASDQFVGKKAVITLSLKNESPKKKYNIKMRAEGVWSMPLAIEEKSSTIESIEIPVLKRGIKVISMIRLSTRYPFGFFESWIWKDVDLKFWVYPHPEGNISLLSNPTNTIDHFDSSDALLSDDFSGHKSYEKGDPIRHLDWKVFARKGGTRSKVFRSGGHEKYLFCWENLPQHLGHEEKLSQLTIWILEAYKKSIPFELHLPHLSLTHFEEKNFKSDCLKALTEFNEIS